MTLNHNTQTLWLPIDCFECLLLELKFLFQIVDYFKAKNYFNFSPHWFLSNEHVKNVSKIYEFIFECEQPQWFFIKFQTKNSIAFTKCHIIDTWTLGGFVLKWCCINLKFTVSNSFETLLLLVLACDACLKVIHLKFNYNACLHLKKIELCLTALVTINHLASF